MNYSDTRILFFDGDCGLCNWAVQWALNWEQSDSALRYAPLQGETSKKLLAPKYRTVPFDSLVVWDRGEVLVEEVALRALAAHMYGWKGKMMQWIFAPLFAPMTRIGYRLVVRYRSRFPLRSCDWNSLPERSRFLP
ncbi:MAG: thiol-disulfide oxidoreductase DCC family protein [Flavobacteriales bacterium]